MKFTFLIFLLFPVLTLLSQADEQVAGEAKITPPVTGLEGWSKSETANILKGFSSSFRLTETRLGSADEAAKIFTEAAFAKLEKRVNFEKQDLIVVQFGGSGQNKLECYFSISKPRKVLFIIEPGATKDLVDQIHVFAVRKDVQSPTLASPGLIPGQWVQRNRVLFRS